MSYVGWMHESHDADDADANEHMHDPKASVESPRRTDVRGGIGHRSPTVTR